MCVHLFPSSVCKSMYFLQLFLERNCSKFGVVWYSICRKSKPKLYILKPTKKGLCFCRAVFKPFWWTPLIKNLSENFSGCAQQNFRRTPNLVEHQIVFQPMLSWYHIICKICFLAFVLINAPHLHPEKKTAFPLSKELVNG